MMRVPSSPCCWRIELPAERFLELRNGLQEIGRLKSLSVRVWSPDERASKPRLAICTTYRPETPSAILDAIQNGVIKADPAVMIGNRKSCQKIAAKHNVPFELIGDEKGNPDEERFVELLDQYEIDYVVLARYMRVLPASTCWRYAGGRIINLHHGLLPSFPGIQPYRDAYESRMLTFGATCHFIVPELDAGNQTIHQETMSVRPGTKLDEIIERGQSDNEPRCLVEGIRRVVDREVQLHFHRVVATVN